MSSPLGHPIISYMNVEKQYIFLCCSVIGHDTVSLLVCMSSVSVDVCTTV